MFLNDFVDYHELLYPLQRDHTPLHWAAEEGHTTCVEYLLSTPGIDVSIKNWASCSIEPPSARCEKNLQVLLLCLITIYGSTYLFQTFLVLTTISFQEKVPVWHHTDMNYF